MINLGGTATTGIGYETSAKYIIPEFAHRDQSLQFAVGAIKQSLQAYDQKAVTTGVTLNRKISSVWSASVGISAIHETIIQEGTTQVYTLFALPLGVLYDSTDLPSPLIDPTHGLRASFSIAPTLSRGQPNTTFVITQASVADYIDLHRWFGARAGAQRPCAASARRQRARCHAARSNRRRQRRACPRTCAGSATGSALLCRRQRHGARLSLPVRRTSIPRRQSGRRYGDDCSQRRVPTAHRHQLRRGGFCRRRRGEREFVGRVATPDAAVPIRPSRGTTACWAVGVGVGARYYTPIGPLRLDFAVPTSRRPNDDKFEIYIGLGQAF